MASTGFLSSLNLGTLVVVLLIAVAALAFFLRKRSNRHPLEGRRERNVGADLDAGRTPPDHSPRR
jgi:hypothetical protein